VKQLKRIILLTLLIILLGLGASVTLKVAIGVGAWDALAQSISHITGIKVGTIGMILNTSCVLGEWILLRKAFNFRHLLQIPVSILLGTVVNLFLYNVLSSVAIDSYAMKLILLIIAFALVAGAVGGLMVLNLVTMPLEGLCMAVSNKIKWKFPVVRQSVDILSILLVLILTFALSLTPTVREGTIIGMLIFAPLMGFFMNKIRPIFEKLELIDLAVETDLGKVEVKTV
jgi:uncharacterized protein